MSVRSTRKIIAALLEDDVGDLVDFKDVMGSAQYRTFNVEINLGIGDPDFSTVINVPAYLLPSPQDDPDETETHRRVKDYAYQHLTDEMSELNVGQISKEAWDGLVNIEETDPQAPMEETDGNE
jgi:hypothetical protein